MAESSATTTLYHYTTPKRGEKIDESKKIKPSSAAKKPLDVKHGEGVYFTAKSPEDHTKQEIAAHNWGPKKSNWYVSIHKVDKVVEVDFPNDKLPACKEDGDRSVYLHPGKVDLNKYNHKVYEYPEKDTSTGLETQFENMRLSKK